MEYEVLRQLYRGEVANAQSICICDEAYEQNVQKLFDAEQTLTQALMTHPALCNLLREYHNLHLRIAERQNEEAFTQGFRLGMKISAACFFSRPDYFDEPQTTDDEII